MVSEQELMKFKVPELKKKLLELGLQPRGLKADLVRQLAEALNLIEQQYVTVQQTVPGNQFFVPVQPVMQPSMVVVQQPQQQPIDLANQLFQPVQMPVQSQSTIVIQQQQQQQPIDSGNQYSEPVQQIEPQSMPAVQESEDSGKHSELPVEEINGQEASVLVQHHSDQIPQQSELISPLDSQSLQEEEQEQEDSSEQFVSEPVRPVEEENCEQQFAPEPVQPVEEENCEQQFAPEPIEPVEEENCEQFAPKPIEPELEFVGAVTKNPPKMMEIKEEEEEDSGEQLIGGGDSSSFDDKENAVVSDHTNQVRTVEEEEFDLQRILKAFDLTEDQWTQMNKNQRRKLKKKLRNKEKRKERDLIERRRQEFFAEYKRQQREELEKQKQKEMDEIKQEEPEPEDDAMDIDEEDEPEEEKERKRQEELRRQQELLAKKQNEEEEQRRLKSETVEIEYVPENMPKDDVYMQFIKVFNKFSAVSSEEAKRLEQERILSESNKNRDDRAKLLELKKPVELELKDEDDQNTEGVKLSKRKLKQMTRMSVADLKQRVNHPELVEMHDITAKDPVLLLYLKSTRNTVPVPRHWCYKRKYLQGKRGFEKPPFKLPEFIRRTGIQEMREAVLEKDDTKSLKTKMKEKIRPKMGKIDIDYQKLHDAFFKWQTKPNVTIHGDLYYEGKEFETRLKDKKPGELSNELRMALGMPTGHNAHKCPPPWLIAMQRYGPPPSYPSIKIPGLNAPIPEGCCFGYHAGGWGKPPVDEYGRPLYGDVFGVAATSREPTQAEEEVDRTHWGEMESDEEEEEEEEDEEKEVEEGGAAAGVKGTGRKDGRPDESGLVTPANTYEGLATPSGLTSGIPSGMETPDMIELRKRKQQIEAEMESGDHQQQLFTVIPEKKVDRYAKDMMGSMHVYDFASLSKNPTTNNANEGGGRNNK